MTDSIFQLARQFFNNGLRFEYLKWTGRPGKPQAVSLEITHHCIAKCIMCSIWKISQEVPDLPIEDWLRLLSSDLFSDLRELDITGGEPFVRNDLMNLFIGLCELKQNNLKALKSIAVTTNGFLTSRVLEYTENILQLLRDNHIGLVIVCAIDAIGEIHERIRNYKDAWFKVNETIEGLKRHREKFPDLIIGLKTTIVPINVGALEDIVRYADSHGLFAIISPCIVTKARYLNYDRMQDLAFSQDDRAELIRFYKSQRFRWSFHGDRLVQYLRTGVMRKPCSCGFNYFFVRSTGAVYLCPLIDASIGNIQEISIKDLFYSEQAYHIRRKIGKFPECKRCTEPGVERYALTYEGFSYLSLLVKLGRKKFLQLHHHLGLDKYLN